MFISILFCLGDDIKSFFPHFFDDAPEEDRRIPPIAERVWQQLPQSAEHPMHVTVPRTYFPDLMSLRSCRAEILGSHLVLPGNDQMRGNTGLSLIYRKQAPSMKGWRRKQRGYQALGRSQSDRSFGKYMKVVVDENVSLGKEAFSEFGEVELVAGRSITKELLTGCRVLIVRSVTRVNRELLEGTPVEFVGTTTIGTDHIDVDYLQGQGIGFASAPGSNADAAAQYVVTATLWWARRKGVSLNSCTIGIIGVGNIGGRVERYARALGMKCILNDPPRQRQSGSDTFVSLDRTLPQADILTLHVPLTKQGPDATRRMANEAFFSGMRDGALFVNASRGEVVDEVALRRNRPKLGGLILDVWQNEPDISTETLALADLATPHVAGYSIDGRMRATHMIYREACRHLRHKEQWQGPPPIAREQIDLSEAQNDDPAEAVLRAYPVQHDDRELRKIAELSPGDRGPYFDGLRKNYPFRKEFSNFEVRSVTAEAGRVLQALDFNVAR